jgi:hypothetical protein
VSAWEIRGPGAFSSKGKIAIVSIIIARRQTFLVLNNVFGVVPIIFFSRMNQPGESLSKNSGHSWDGKGTDAATD